ncbi:MULTISPECIES: Ref family recombination enhancement nuclease [unclassified Pseudomonas]|uniref:Ref family recombination enhancement nuclease n=1 Tax=unclassified Pseudomonas TaxID=196821 RepID=UPI00131D962D|nr:MULTISPECIES: Ref family recombination enhancement nuclease [unclassified Pseudomonas]
MSSKRGGATSAERRFLDRVVSLGCIACHVLGFQDTPAEIHHIRTGAGGGQRSSNLRVLPLCPVHHRQGGYGVAYHAGRVAWEAVFGTELMLLAKVYLALGIDAPGPTDGPDLEQPFVFEA